MQKTGSDLSASALNDRAFSDDREAIERHNNSLKHRKMLVFQAMVASQPGFEPGAFRLGVLALNMPVVVA